jgi:hypothetical protein
MVLHPISSGESSAPGAPPSARSAWEAVELKQKEHAEHWWLIAQPDHAALAGDLAARLDPPFFPKLN